MKNLCKNIHLCLLFFLLDAVFKGFGEESPQAIQLVNNLMAKYPKKLIRPVHNETTTTTVIHGLSLIHIKDLDEKNQILTSKMWVRQYWNDEYLTWDPADYGDVVEIRIPFNFLWQPDLVIYNSGSEKFFQKFDSEAVISYKGEIGAFSIAMFESTCKVDSTYFPFDEQKCKLKFGSWSYHGFLVDLTNESSSGDISQFNTNGEWDLISMAAERNEVMYPCCIEFYPDVTYTIHIRRRSLFYVVSIILPCMLMSILVLVGFYLPPESGEKITLSITCQLSLMVFLVMVGEHLPPTSEFVPYVEIYFMTTIGLVTSSVAMNAFILNMHHSDSPCIEVPDWLRKFTKFLQRIFFHQQLKLKAKNEHDQCLNKDSINELHMVDISLLSTDLEYVANGINELLHKIIRQNYNLLRQLKTLISGMDVSDREERMQKEWKEVAKVLDRLFLFVFSLVMLIATVVILLLLMQLM